MYEGRINININPADIQVDTFNTGSGWFPKYNGVRVTHKPTGLYVQCDTERSQHANRWRAVGELINCLNNESDYTKQMELF